MWFFFLAQVCIYDFALSCECARMFGSEGVGNCVFTLIMLTSTLCVCVCVWAQEPSRVMPFSGCISICQSVHVSGVYKTLGVGVCSCVYSACPEIVTELHKQFTVNKPFPYSNKGPMRLNSVPPSQPPPVMKNRISGQPKHSAALLYFITFTTSAQALPMILQSLQLNLVYECVGKCSFMRQGPTICTGMSYCWSTSWQMNMLVGLMEAPGKRPLIKDLQWRVDGLYHLLSSEPTRPAEPPPWASRWVNGWTPIGEWCMKRVRSPWWAQRPNRL